METNSFKRLLTTESLNLFVFLNLFQQILRVQAPDHNVMVNSPRNELLAVSCDIDRQHLVAMALNASKNGNARRVLAVPQPY